MSVLSRSPRPDRSALDKGEAVHAAGMGFLLDGRGNARRAVRALATDRRVILATDAVHNGAPTHGDLQLSLEWTEFRFCWQEVMAIPESTRLFPAGVQTVVSLELAHEVEAARVLVIVPYDIDEWMAIATASGVPTPV